MMRKTGILFAVLLIVNSVFAQADIEFEKQSHSFGKVREIDGPAVCEFRFKNTGNQPLVIREVKPSCGCTVPEWPKEAVKPGETGIIKASFKTENRPGSFNKSVTVVANTQPATHVLTFSGFVVAKQITLNEDFPHQIGLLRFKSETVDFGTVEVGGEVNKEIEVYNSGREVIKFSGETDLPGHISVHHMDSILQPGDIGKIKIVYSPGLKNEFGEVSDELVLMTDEEADRKKKLFIKAEITDVKEKETLPEENKPSEIRRVELSSEYITIDTVKAGKVIVRDFQIRNNGEQDLLIRKISAPGHIKVDPNKGTVKPGQKVKFKVTYNSKGKVGTESSVIKIYSNNPQSPVIELPVKGEVIR